MNKYKEAVTRCEMCGTYIFEGDEYYRFKLWVYCEHCKLDLLDHILDEADEDVKDTLTDEELNQEAEKYKEVA